VREVLKAEGFAPLPRHHLLIQTPQANASAAMQWLNVSYSVWFNRRHRRCDPLFQGRFKSIPVEGEGAWALQASLQWIEEYLRQGVQESAPSGLTAAVAIGSVKFLERMRRQVKGDGTEQHDLRRWQRMQRDRHLCNLAKKAQTIMSHVQR
jgi:hypothetical protein